MPSSFYKKSESRAQHQAKSQLLSEGIAEPHPVLFKIREISSLNLQNSHFFICCTKDKYSINLHSGSLCNSILKKISRHLLAICKQKIKKGSSMSFLVAGSRIELETSGL